MSNDLSGNEETPISRIVERLDLLGTFSKAIWGSEEIFFYGLLTCGDSIFRSLECDLKKSQAFDEVLPAIEELRTHGWQSLKLFKTASDGSAVFEMRTAEKTQYFVVGSHLIVPPYLLNLDGFIHYIEAQSDSDRIWARVGEAMRESEPEWVGQLASAKANQLCLTEHPEVWWDMFWVEKLFNRARQGVSGKEIIPKELESCFKMRMVGEIFPIEDLTATEFIEWVNCQEVDPQYLWTRISDAINHEYGPKFDPLGAETVTEFLTENPDMYGKVKPRTRLLAQALQRACEERTVRVHIPETLEKCFSGGRAGVEKLSLDLDVELVMHPDSEKFVYRLAEVLEAIEVDPGGDAASIRKSFIHELNTAEAIAASEGSSFRWLFTMILFILETKTIQFKSAARENIGLCQEYMKHAGIDPRSGAGTRLIDILCLAEVLREFDWNETRLRDVLAISLFMSDAKAYSGFTFSLREGGRNLMTDVCSLYELDTKHEVLQSCWRSALALFCVDFSSSKGGS